MSKYHNIRLDRDYIVRDVPFLPNSKKIRVAPIELKHRIMELLSTGENLAHLRFITNRIHFFIESHHLDEEDEVIIGLIERGLDRYKNTIEIK